MKTFTEKINQDVLNATGFDVPELSGGVNLSRPAVLQALRHAKDWHENFAQECESRIDKIIAENFSLDERLD